MVLVRSFMREISPILHLSAVALALSRYASAVPVYESLSTKDHGEELGRILCSRVSILQPRRRSSAAYQIHSRARRPPCHICRSLRAAGRR